MCGICGFFQAAPILPDAEDLVVAMRDEMVHRGPDGCGVRVGRNYALGHRRLKIVDLSEHARQPMSNEDGSVWVTFNGEIYNHLDIRPELEARGHQFRSRSDTEVIVHGWEEWGEGLVDRLTGMFAFAIADERRHCYFISRDRIGIKPLFYFRRDGLLVFASEIKSLLRHPDCPRGLRTDVLGEYLIFRNIAGARTILDGVEELVPGHSLLVDRDIQGSARRYWRVSLSNGNGQSTMSQKQFGELMRHSVGTHMMSDVPLGTQLSGGLDSSVITALAAKFSPFAIKTFSVGIDVPGFNEFPYSTQVSQSLGTDHCAIPASAQDFDRELDDMVWYMDLPIDHPNSIFLYMLCKRAKQDVTVLLTGEGADEMLAGYHRYAYYQQVMEKVKRVPSWIKSIAARLPQGLDLRKVQLLKAWNTHGPAGMAVRNSSFGSARLVDLLEGDAPVDLSVRERIIGEFSADGTPVEALLRLDQEVYLVSLLHRQDRVSMAASIEARVPFLDHHVIEAINQLSSELKINTGRGKYLLRQAAQGLIPTDVVDRRKMGFPIPLGTWFRNGAGLGPRLDVLVESGSLCSRLFKRSGIQQLIDEHRTGRRDFSEDLWILLSLELWHRRFLTSPSAVIPHASRRVA